MKHLSALLSLCLAATAHAQVTHEIHVMDNQFVPADLSIELGDAIHLIFDDDGHSLVQVTQSTWMANGNDPLPGGYIYGTDTPNPGADFTFTPSGLGTIYYVCSQHADMGMKGTIDVTANIGIADHQLAPGIVVAPNPASDRIALLNVPALPLEVEIHDAAGHWVSLLVPAGASAFDVGSLAPGYYTLLVRDRDQHLLARERIMIAR